MEGHVKKMKDISGDKLPRLVTWLYGSGRSGKRSTVGPGSSSLLEQLDQQ